jgi:hypothetical protein
MIKSELLLDNMKLQTEPLFSLDIQTFHMKSIAVALFVIMLQMA